MHNEKLSICDLEMLDNNLKDFKFRHFSSKLIWNLLLQIFQLLLQWDNKKQLKIQHFTYKFSSHSLTLWFIKQYSIWHRFVNLFSDTLPWKFMEICHGIKEWSLLLLTKILEFCWFKACVRHFLPIFYFATKW